MARPSFVIVLLVGVLAATLGPRITSPQDVPAGVPFEYVPPKGFVLEDKTQTQAILGAEAAEKIWVHPIVGGYVPNVTLVTTRKSAVTDPKELDHLVEGMPGMFSSGGITWTEVRHELRSRPDGSRVAIIEGQCEKGTLKYRSMQMVFPHDTGTAIVTASFPIDDAQRWERDFEESVTASKGVAVRRPAPAPWVHAAWGVGAATIAYLGLALRGKKDEEKPKPESGPKARPKKRDDDDDDA